MTSNPMLKTSVYDEAQTDLKPMTISGTINKTLVLTGIVALCAMYTWHLCSTGFSDKAMLMTTMGIIIGFILAIITAFKPKYANYTAPTYALCEGMVVGSVSYIYETAFNGIVVNALSITILTLMVMLFAYQNKIIQATERFKQVILTSTIAIAIFYLIGFIGALLGYPMTVFNGGLTGIIISLVICVIAALNFILDFDFIKKGAQIEAPEYLEWYGAFSLLVTLVWLYFEVLRLLAQFNSRK